MVKPLNEAESHTYPLAYPAMWSDMRASHSGLAGCDGLEREGTDLSPSPPAYILPGHSPWLRDHSPNVDLLILLNDFSIRNNYPRTTRGDLLVPQGRLLWSSVSLLTAPIPCHVLNPHLSVSAKSSPLLASGLTSYSTGSCDRNKPECPLKAAVKINENPSSKHSLNTIKTMPSKRNDCKLGKN